LKIQGRIFSVIFLVQITFVISILLYFLVLLQPVSRIQSEQAVLQQLERTIHREILTLHRIVTGQFSQEVDNYRARSLETNDAFRAVSELEFIPSISKSTGDAINAIGRLRALIEGNRNTFFAAAKELTSAAEEQFNFIRTFQMKRLLEEGLPYPEVRAAGVQTLN
jgi:hypothetical protein